MPFQLNAKNILLTYANCTLTKEELLSELLKLQPFTYISIGHEIAPSTNLPHLHAYIYNETNIRTKNERYFDINSYHPNIVSCRKPKEAKEYTQKEGNFLEHGQHKDTTKRGWHDILESATTADEFLEQAKTEFSRDFIINLERLQYFTNYYYKPKIEPYLNPNYTFNIPTDLQTFASQMFQVNTIRLLFIILVGSG